VNNRQALTIAQSSNSVYTRLAFRHLRQSVLHIVFRRRRSFLHRLDDYRASRRQTGRKQLGVQANCVDQIIGTVDHTNQYDAEFYPRNFTRINWARYRHILVTGEVHRTVGVVKELLKLLAAFLLVSARFAHLFPINE
jgi:hypothetical protein